MLSTADLLIRRPIREEYTLTEDRIAARAKQGQARVPGTGKRVDVVLFPRPNIPAVAAPISC